MDILEFFLCGRRWQVQKADMEQLWEEMVKDSEEKHVLRAKDSEEKNVVLTKDSSAKQDSVKQSNEEDRPPYWAVLWPSSLILAELLYDRKELIQGKNCLDMGCGLGFTAIMGAFCKAKVLGVDFEEQAICFAQQNLKLNNITDSITFQQMDWRAPTFEAHSFDFVWGADILYEQAAAKTVLDFLEYSLSPQGTVWIAEPSRTIFSYLIDILEGSSFEIRKILTKKTEDLSAGVPLAQVNIWELKRS